MKKLLLGLLLIVLTSSCTTNVSKKTSEYTINGYDLSIFEIDGCEYVGMSIGWNNGVLTHKGNCKNPIHKCK